MAETGNAILIDNPTYTAAGQGLIAYRVKPTKDVQKQQKLPLAIVILDVAIIQSIETNFSSFFYSSLLIEFQP